MAKVGKGNDPQQEPKGAPKEPKPAEPRAEIIQEIQAVAETIRASAAAVQPLAGSLTPEQIDRILKLNEERLRLQAEDRTQLRRYLLGALVAAFLFLSVLWVSALHFQRPELVSDLVKMLGGLAGGLLGGYGLRGATEPRRRRRR